jgi:hypothetical protein
LTSNAEIEMRWVDAWNDLYDIVQRWEDTPCLLPDGSEVSVEQCKGWLQESVYEGYRVEVRRGLLRGRPAVVASRSKPEGEG